MQKNTLKILFAISLSLLVSCATKPPDVPVFVELSPTRGFGVYTISAKEFIVDNDHAWNGKTWWELRPSMIYLPADSWKEIKKFILKICKNSNMCGDWKTSVNKIDKIIK